MSRRLVALFALPLLLTGCPKGGPAPDSGGVSGAHGDHALLGSAAPDFELPGVDSGASVTLAAHRGKVVIVDFWATWCEPCKASFPFYQSLADKHGGQVVVLGLSVDEEPDSIAAFANETGAKFPIAWDEGQGVSHRYNPPTMPTSFLIDKNGIVRYVHAGFRDGDRETLSAEVDKLL